MTTWTGIEDNTPLGDLSGLPAPIAALIARHGRAVSDDGYLRLVAPDDLRDLLPTIYERAAAAVPCMTTALADIIVWEDGFLRIIKPRWGRVDVLAKNPEALLSLLDEPAFRNDDENLGWNPYPEAVERVGPVPYDSCLGFAPLLSLGGSPVAANLHRVNLAVHLRLIAQAQAPMP